MSYLTAKGMGLYNCINRGRIKIIKYLGIDMIKHMIMIVIISRK